MIEKHIQLYEYELPGDWQVLAGKTDIDNDHLSLKIAKPNDHWFHVRGLPGSHVLLRAKTGKKPDHATIECAAAIAAYHSKARNGGLTSVSCTLAKFVSKPRGAKPGSVAIRRESVLRVRPLLPEI